MSGVWCVQLQGGGGSRRGASASDDNAADGRARPRVLGVIRRTGPRPPGCALRAHGGLCAAWPLRRVRRPVTEWLRPLVAWFTQSIASGELCTAKPPLHMLQRARRSTP
ncbi:hypothetical protein E7X38_17130 [Streptomyces sp. Akac8]|nr:hypothetical protein E7X38_17130 [Streptomyces sp. Akac8]